MAKYRNARDEEEAAKEELERERLFRELMADARDAAGKLGPDALKKGLDDLIAKADQGASELPIPDTAGGWIKLMKDAAASVKGQTMLAFSTDDSVTFMQPTGEYGLTEDGDGLAVQMEFDGDNGIDVGQMARDMEGALSRMKLGPDAPLQFVFRGNELQIVEVALMTHEDDDNATLGVTCAEAEVDSARKPAPEKFSTPGQIALSMDQYMEENYSDRPVAFEDMKIVGLVEDGGEQKVFQIMYPSREGKQLVFRLARCQDWRFKEVNDDPSTMTVIQFMTHVTSGSIDGYVFFKARDVTYEACGVEELDAPQIGLGQMIALRLKPWGELDESRRSPEQACIWYWAHMLDEAMGHDA